MAPVRLGIREFVPVSLVFVLMAGCNLLTDYSDHPFANGDADDSPKKETGSDVDAALDTADGTSPRDDVDGGLPKNQCLSDFSQENTYRVRPVPSPSSIEIDGNCSDAEFGHTEALPTSVDTSSDNSWSCKFLWWNTGVRARLHGCCEIEDGERVAKVAQGDPPRDIFRVDGTGDDRLEYWMKCNLDRQRDRCSYKIFMNPYLNSSSDDMGTPTFFAARYKPSMNAVDFGWSPDRTAMSRHTDTGYVLEWTADIGPDIQSGHRALCNVVSYDVDGSGENGEIIAFGPEKSINDPDEWGCCFFE